MAVADPPGLCSQRELDAMIAVAAKKAGIVYEDTRFGADRDALLEELRHEREVAARVAEDGGEEAPREITAENLFKR